MNTPLAVAGATTAAAFALDRPEAEVGAGDRLSFALFLVAALHVAIILGISFVMPEPREASRSLEVTLAQFQSREVPIDADYMAQADQEASGDLDEAREMTTDRPSRDDDAHLADAFEPVPPVTREDTVVRSITSTASPFRVEDSEAVITEPEPAPDLRDLMLRRAQALSSLDARQSIEVQQDARGPRVRRITSASTRTAVEAAYVNAWRNKIETLGNLNYPAEARRRSLEGDLRVLVEIDASGALRDVRILDSSGSAVLDEAAMRIVRLGAPYLPFPEEMRREADILQIVRTWQFRRGMVDSG
ncbi:MAG: energy transducer TonB [Gammaproteobacteria bacterium]|nr:energy transducer TonB [Gammaproteobacteria bacterium]